MGCLQSKPKHENASAAERYAVAAPVADPPHPGNHVVEAVAAPGAPAAPAAPTSIIAPASTAPAPPVETPSMAAREDLAPPSPGAMAAPSPSGAATTPFMFKTQHGDTSEIQTPSLSAGPSQLQQRSEAAMTPSLNFGPLQTPAEEEAEETEEAHEAHDSEAPATLEASIPAQITPSILDFNDSSRFIFEGDRTCGIRNTLRRYNPSKVVRIYNTPFQERVERELQAERDRAAAQHDLLMGARPDQSAAKEQEAA